MSFQPLSSANSLQNVRLVATDMDGTLTTYGKFTPSLLQALIDLATVGVKVLIVTGRSAGWVSGLSALLPIAGAIAENGGIFYSQEQPGVFLTPIPNLIQHRRQLRDAFEQLKAKFPQIQESSDNLYRLTDWTFDNHQLTLNDLQTLNDLCQELGWGFTYSSVQCHIKPISQDKATGLLQVLQPGSLLNPLSLGDYDSGSPQNWKAKTAIGDYNLDQVVTVGDSPNDASLFSLQFPLSVGVANLRHYQDQLPHHPTYITEAAEGEGFCELAQRIISVVRMRDNGSGKNR